MVKFSDLLDSITKDFSLVTPYHPLRQRHIVFDLSENNHELSGIDLNDQKAFTDYIFNTLKSNDAEFGIGKYNEDRLIYKRSDLFSGAEPRSLHLGIDIWAPAGTPVIAPLDGTIHSFADNANHGDYGPTIILKHLTEDKAFHTLYGHLSKSSLSGLYEGKQIERGLDFAEFGTYEENVHWPPHLHFQVIIDMGDYFGDYPGVCKPSEKEQWLTNSPDPGVFCGLYS